MKLENTQTDWLDIEKLELEYKDDQFWQDIQEFLRYGVPSKDEKGHGGEIRVRVRPLQIDMIGAIAEKMPDKWFKSQAALNRSIIAAGCRVILKLLGMDKNTEWGEILTGLNQIAKKKRLQEFKDDMAIMKSELINGSMAPEDKVKVVDMMERLEKKFMRL